MASEQSTQKARQMLRDAIGGDETPRRTLTNIPYPSGGVSESYSFSSQPPGTSRDERNMRSFDPHTGRLRGSQRVGLGKYGDGLQVGGAATKIAGIASVTREINPYSWSEGVSNRFTVPADKGSLNCTDIHRDEYGTYYILGEYGDVQRVNADGGVIDDFDSQHYENDDATLNLRTDTIVSDPFQNVFIATGHRAGATSETYSLIHCYEYRIDGSYARAWTVNPGMFVLDMAIYGFDLFVWGCKHNGASAATYECIRYAEYKFDVAPEVDLSSTFSKDGPTVTSAQTEDLHVGRMAVASDGTVYATWSRYGTTGSNAGKLVQAGIYKLQPISPTSSEEVWVESYGGGDNWATGTKDHQGYGLGVLIGPSVDLVADDSHGMTRLWLWGGQNNTPVSMTDVQPRVRLVIDDPVNGLQLDSSLNIDMQAAAGTATNGWKTGSTYDNLHMRGTADDEFVAYIPYGVSDAASTYSSDAFLAIRYVPDDGAGTSEHIEVALSPTAAQIGGGLPILTSIAVPLLRPLYNEATNVKTTDLAVCGGAIGTSGFAVGADLATYTATSDLREIRTIAFTGGGVYRLNDPGAATQILNKTGGTAAYSTSMNYIQAATGAGHIYFTDGIDYFNYSAEFDHVTKLRSTNLGDIPKRARLMEFWRNRLVIARSDRLPGSWHMSRSGDVGDWDQFPQTPDTFQAVSGTTSPAGECPDSINAIVPYSDDILWFGCDSSIWQMTGEPTSATFDMVTDEVGMSFGRPFCRDDVGQLWFFGSKGGLYTFNNGLEDVARGKVRNRLRAIDLGLNFIILEYNYADDGIHIFVCPFGSPTATPTDHYFYDKRTGAFHIDKFGGDSDYVEPTSACVIDGDAGKDRAILIGTGNGHIHRWGSGVDGVIPKSDQKTNNSTVGIDSYVLIGPIAEVHDMSESALSELAVILAPNYSGVHIEVFSTDTPDRLGDPVWKGEIHAGRNANQLVRVTGDSIYIRMRNASIDEHWAIEKCSAILSYGGQIRSDT